MAMDARSVGFGLGAVVIVAAVFFGTLYIMNPAPESTGGDSAGTGTSTESPPTTTSNPSTTTTTTSTPSDIPANAVYALDPGSKDKNWSAGNANTQLDVEGSEIRLVSDESFNSFQLLSMPIDARANESYSVHYDISVEQGTLRVGALDVKSGLVIDSKPISSASKGADAVPFKAMSDQFKVVVFNYNQPPQVSKATISKIWVERNEGP
jgi:hypothetical protein